MGWSPLLSQSPPTYCDRITNKAEAAADLRRKRLTLLRLQVHSQAQSSSFGALLKTLRVKSLRPIAALYLLALVLLSGVSTIFGIVFVLETTRAKDGVTANTSNITISADISPDLDQCAVKLSEGTCTYDLAASALSSQLITHTPYTMGGVTFRAPNGTFGLPYEALNHFVRAVNESIFGDEKRQYCLPTLNRKLVSCVRDESRVYYDPEPLYLQDGFVYPITIDPNQRTSAYDYRRLEHRLLTLNGTMVVAQSRVPDDEQTTVITATGEYGDILSHLMTGGPPDTDMRGDQQFTVACEMYNLSRPGFSTWRWTSLVLDSGVMTVDVTDEDCTLEEQQEHLHYPSTGFANLPFAIEATTKVLGGIDGYSKLINYDSFGTQFSQLTIEDARAYAKEADMNLLESLLSQMLGIVHTSWTAIVGDVNGVKRVQIMQRRFPHHYIIKTFWTPATVIAVVVAALIFLTTLGQAICWWRAVRALGKDEQVWRLLDPDDMMEYALIAADDIRLRPETGANAQKVSATLVLQEYPRRIPTVAADSQTEDGATLVGVSSPTDTVVGEKETGATKMEKEIEAGSTSA